jgi:hypothetical protein
VAGETSGPHLALTPDPLKVAAAAESAISAPALIIRRRPTYYGPDPEPHLRQSQQRRDMLDVLMREQAVKQITNPAPLVPAQLPPVRQRTPGQPWTSGADMAMSAATQNPLIRHALPDDGHEVDGRA